MIETLLDDAARITHLLCVAAGFGIAIETEIFASRRMHQPVTERFVKDVEARHLLISLALLGMWFTGLILVAMRTGLDLAQFSPKLTTKIATVSILTCNSLMISMVVIPVLRDHLRRPLATLPRRKLTLLFAVAGFSGASWLFAMVLGGATSLKTAPQHLFQIALPVIYGLAVPIAIVVGFRVLDLPLMPSRPTQKAPAYSTPPHPTRTTTDRAPDQDLRDALLGR